MNFWIDLPNRDEVLEKIFRFLQLLSENLPDDAEKLVNVGNMDKFRDNLHYFLADYSMMILDDQELADLPDDLSTSILDPYLMDENDIQPSFTGNEFILKPNETIDVKIGLRDNITNIKIRFMIYEMEGKYYLNLMRILKY